MVAWVIVLLVWVCVIPALVVCCGLRVARRRQAGAGCEGALRRRPVDLLDVGRASRPRAQLARRAHQVERAHLQLVVDATHVSAEPPDYERVVSRATPEKRKPSTVASCSGRHENYVTAAAEKRSILRSVNLVSGAERPSHS
jgi:hypothetical protein